MFSFQSVLLVLPVYLWAVPPSLLPLLLPLDAHGRWSRRGRVPGVWGSPEPLWKGKGRAGLVVAVPPVTFPAVLVYGLPVGPIWELSLRPGPHSLKSSTETSSGSDGFSVSPMT